MWKILSSSLPNQWGEQIQPQLFPFGKTIPAMPHPLIFARHNLQRQRWMESNQGVSMPPETNNGNRLRQSIREWSILYTPFQKKTTTHSTGSNVSLMVLHGSILFWVLLLILMLSHVRVISYPSSGQIIIPRESITGWLPRESSNTHCHCCFKHETSPILWPRHKSHPLLLGLEPLDFQLLLSTQFILEIYRLKTNGHSTFWTPCLVM